MFTNEENLTTKTPLSDFKVTTPETPLLSQQAVTNKGISVPYTNLQLNPYPNTQLDLFCSDTYYAYLKVRMRAFLQSLDEKLWQAVEIGWTKPIEVPTDWDNAKIKVANFNSRALNALFSAVMNEDDRPKMH